MPITLNGDTGITTPGLTNTGSTTLVNLTTTGNTILGDQSTDTLNVANGNLVLNSSGNVGIGTASPTTKLSITDSAGPVVRLVRTSNRFELSADTDFMSLNARDASTYITFKTADTERVRITAAGDVGIGTSSVNTRLHVVGLNQTNGTAEFTPNASKGSIASYVHYGTNGDWYIRSASASGNVNIQDTGGNVGIGTGSPLSPLDVVVGASGARRFLVNYDDSVITIKGANATPNPEALRLVADNFRFNTGTTGSGTERMRLDLAGRLGLGMTPSGSYSLQIYGVGSAGSGSARIRLNNSSTGTADADGGGIAMEGVDLVIQNSENGVCKWEINGSERARITSAGNVGIGTTSPSSILTLSQAQAPITTFWGSARADGNPYTAGGIESTFVTRDGVPALGAFIRILDVNTFGAFPTTIRGGAITFGTVDGLSGQGVNATERARIDSSGNFGIGTTTLTEKLNLGGNLVFRQSSNITTSTGFLNIAPTSTLILDTGDSIQFRIASSERMRLDSSGVLLVNRTSYIAGVGSSCKLQVLGGQGEWSLGVTNGGSTQPYGILMGYGAAPNTANWPFFLGADSAATRFSVYSNGGIANYSANDVNLSDRREKKNFAPAKSYLDVICSIPVQTFNYIDQNMEDDDGLTLGVVAQDVLAVAPELVMESNWANKDEEPKIRLSVYQTDLQYALMKCIQELKSELDSVKTELAALKGN